MSITVRLEGVDELRKQFQLIVKSVHPDKTEPILMKHARRLAVKVRKNTPRGPTGRLKRSVVAKKLKRQFGQAAPAIVAMDRKKAPHAHLVEFGHAIVKNGQVIGHVPAHPYFRNTVDENHDSTLRDVTADLQKLIEKVAK